MGLGSIYDKCHITRYESNTRIGKFHEMCSFTPMIVGYMLTVLR